MSDDSNVSQLPESINFDLDTVERDPKEVKPPFRTKVGDRVIEMVDPSTLDWRDVMLMTNPTDLIRLSLSAEDRTHLQSVGFESWKFGKLLEAYSEHFELDKLVEDARRQGALGGGGNF